MLIFNTKRYKQIKIIIFKLLQEMLYESQIAILQLHYERTQMLETVLKETLSEVLNIYPNNFYALSVFAGIEVKALHFINNI